MVILGRIEPSSPPREATLPMTQTANIGVTLMISTNIAQLVRWKEERGKEGFWLKEIQSGQHKANPGSSCFPFSSRGTMKTTLMCLHNFHHHSTDSRWIHLSFFYSKLFFFIYWRSILIFWFTVFLLTKITPLKELVEVVQVRGDVVEE